MLLTANRDLYLKFDSTIMFTIIDICMHYSNYQKAENNPKF